MQPKELLTLVRQAKIAGLTVATGTNGTLITEKLARMLIRHGLLNIVISLDSHKAKVHDSLRNIPHTFDKVENWEMQTGRC